MKIIKGDFRKKNTHSIVKKQLLDLFFPKNVTLFIRIKHPDYGLGLLFFFNNSKATETGINNSYPVTSLILKDSEIYYKHNPI